jgi:hypothetical protein
LSFHFYSQWILYFLLKHFCKNRMICIHMFFRRCYLILSYCIWLVGTRDLRTLWGAPAGLVRVAQAGLARPSCPVHPRLACWAHCLAPNCITHPHWMYKRPWHLARPPTVVAMAVIRECLWRTHRQTNTTFALIYRIKHFFAWILGL